MRSPRNSVRFILRLELCWWNVPERPQQSSRIEPVHPRHGGERHGLEGAPRALPSNHLRLVQADHRLGEGIVRGIALAAARWRDAGVHEAIRIPHREILRPGITVMHAAGEGGAPAGVNRLLQRIEHAGRAPGGRHPPAHHAARKHVDDERDVDEATPGRDVREVGDPALIRTSGHALAVDEVHGAAALPGVGRGDPGPTPDGAGEAHRAHEARHGAARHADAFPPQRLPDFPGAVDLRVLVIAPLNLDAELIVALRPRGPGRRICPLVPMAMSPSTGRHAGLSRPSSPQRGSPVKYITALYTGLVSK